MSNTERLAALQEYIVRTKEILDLSALQLEDIASSEEYRVQLQQAFRRIGELGQENNKALESYFFPLLDPSHVHTPEDVDDLRTLGSMLIDTTSMENLDIPLIYLQAERIMENAEKSGDLGAQIRAWDVMIIAAYMMVNLTLRLYPERDDCFRYRDKGLQAAYAMLEYLEPEKFAMLPDDACKETVLINSRYIRCLFEWDDKGDWEAVNAEDFRLMERALALAEDPFYREQMPDYPWDAHVFRTLQYLADFTEKNNKHHFSHDELVKIDVYTTRLIQFLEEHPALQGGCPDFERDFYKARNAYLAGRTSLEEYRDALRRTLRSIDTFDYSARSMFVILSAPLEYILSLDPDHLTQEQAHILHRIYKEIAAYAYHMPKTGVLSFMLTFLADILKNFIVVEEGPTFSEMCLQIMAAMHPPTYVHTLGVANITRYLTAQLLEKEPERFVGIAGAKTVQEVQDKKEEILQFAYNATTMHDIGKLMIVETIITYGRNLIDLEWGLIKSHTEVGAALLRRYPETAEYADIALGHHKWYDNTNGYPENFDRAKSKYATIVSIVEIADCLDAATDSVGRSYKQGKSLDEVIAEFRAESGTRYAPYVVELFDDPAICAELQKLITENRDENYHQAYRILKAL